jgi:hypothetical protein
MEVNKYQLYFNTAQRTNGTSQHPYFACKPAYVKKSPLNWFEIQITSCEIPYQWTQVNQSNSSLGFTYSRTGSSTITGTLILTNGNYDVNSLITEVFYQLSLAIPSYTWVNNSYFNQPTNKIVFSIIGTDNVATSITFNFAGNLFLGGMFGCDTNTTFSYNALNVSTNAMSSTTINVNPVSSIYIRSSMLKQLATNCGNSQENLVAGYTQDISDIINKIQVLTPPFTYVFWLNQVGVRTKISNSSIDQIDVYLSDNRSFDLNITQDWTFAMAIYEYSPTNHQYTDFVDKYSGNLHDAGAFSKQSAFVGDISLSTEQTTADNEEPEPVTTAPVKKFQRSVPATMK